MRVCSEPATVLVIEPDISLSQVLSKTLARDDLAVFQAVNSTEAMQVARQHALSAVVIDCGHRDNMGIELAYAFQERYPELPLVLMSDQPLGPGSFPLGQALIRTIIKPLDVSQLRRAVDAALAWRLSTPEICPTSPQLRRLTRLAKEFVMSVFLTKVLRPALMIVIVGVVLTGFLMAMGIVSVPWQAQAAATSSPPPKKEALGVELVPDQPHTLAVPEEVRLSLGIRKGNKDLIHVAQKPTQTRPLTMPGSTALDPTLVFRIRARFAPSPSSAEVIQVGQIPEDPAQSGKTETVLREIRSGDRVQKGDLLAVFESVDVGNKKNDLIDAMYQLHLDEEILKAAEANPVAVPAVFLWNAQRNVHTDRNAIQRAVSTLRTWGIPEADIQAVRAEAENVIKRKGEHNRDKDELWARVEIRSPADGVIIERNVSLHEIVVDNTTNLFQIAKVDRLSVFAYCPEDDLPALESLPTAKRRWTVQTVGSPPIEGFFEDISYLIDPNQHTAVVKGHINNPKEILRGTQFISATVELPPPPDVVEVPIDAVVEDGQQGVVFVQSDWEKHPEYLTMRRVQLTHRFDRTAYVRSKGFAKQEQPKPDELELGVLPFEPLQPGDRIIRSGVGELKAALLDKEAQPHK
jgi:cobalt-zinc-cadmium efflux system membrane fusion protein